MNRPNITTNNNLRHHLMNRLKAALVTIMFLSSNANATSDITFSTELSEGQKEEQITLTFDTGKTCDLHIKSGFFSASKDSCKFQLTKRVHTFTIKGELHRENYEETGIEIIPGTGEGVIFNIKDDIDQLNKTTNIDQLFTLYRDTINSVNAALPADIKIPQLTFSDKESIASVTAYQTAQDLALPKGYINMITQYGYPESFIPLNKQESIADVYHSYDYTSEQFDYHDGIEKNKVFFRENEEVPYLFYDVTKTVCPDNPIIDYTIVTEGDYSNIDLADIDKSSCTPFFIFLQNQIVDRFIDDISNTTQSLTLDDEVSVEAYLYYDENYDEDDDDAEVSSLYYYFDYW